MKKVAVVLTSTLVVAVGAVAPTVVSAHALVGARAASVGPSVTVQIKTMNKTLLAPKKVHGGKGWITKGKTPTGKCPASSAAGALNAATHGRWTGTYFKSVGGIFITSILGVKPAKKDFWSVFVNGKSSSKGICDIKLRAGQRLLFKIVS
jgi:Domain of unknown function (DUF4430)